MDDAEVIAGLSAMRARAPATRRAALLAYIRLLYDVEKQAPQSAEQNRIALASKCRRLRQGLAGPRLARCAP